MKKIVLITILFTCAWVSHAQVNHVKNPSFEEYATCPSSLNQISFAKYWTSVTDSVGTPYCAPEYINTCGSTGLMGAPVNFYFYQYPRSGNGMAMQWMYSDTVYAVTDTLNRDYLLGRLNRKLKNGTSYCVTFYVCLTEISQYGVNNIGAYLDDGSINGLYKCGRTITGIHPQVYTNTVISDTGRWTKIEGVFTAKGAESYITIGNFFGISSTAVVIMPAPSSGTNHFANYIIDDVSVIETNLSADAGIDKGIHLGDSTFIGRGLDSAFGLDCKWYHKSSLIDSGAGIWVKPTAKGIDTYAVVQTICGNVKTDTVLVYTFDVGIDELPGFYHQEYELFPNPSDGVFTIRQMKEDTKPARIIVYNSLGSIVYSNQVVFSQKKYSMQLSNLPAGMYAMQVIDNSGRSQSMRFTLKE